MLINPINVLLPSGSAQADIDKHVLDAKSLFSKMRRDGQYQQLTNHFYVYRITDQKRTYIGLIAGVDTSEFVNGNIVHHERTISTKVSKQTEVARKVGGFSKPILLTSRARPVVTEIMNRSTAQLPLLDIYLQKYNAQHQLWAITDHSDIDRIIQSLKEMEKAYIVDGHHRTRAIEAISKDPKIGISSGLCALFDIDQLDILPFHRIVDLDISSDLFLSKLSAIATLNPLAKARFPAASEEIILLTEGNTYHLAWKEKPTALPESLDVDLLSKRILRDILHIENESASTKVAYIEGNQTLEVIQSKLTGKGKVAFLLHPLSREAFIDTVNAGNLLPPKSTWFLPRMANGIVSMVF